MWKYVAFASALLFPLMALAQDADLVFNALDSNRDGRITLEEAQVNQMVTAYFQEADTNNDGVLSRVEFQAAFGRN